MSNGVKCTELLGDVLKIVFQHELSLWFWRERVIYHEKRGIRIKLRSQVTFIRAK